ncbi:hypothetical protein MLD38_005201 [Melastoma candidum]|uniref:Uncharacterized protein n=1 Tax=Melastoma candidum TaxID=119954 RepID=A0ACB9SCZ3_9MYRT|nr:hypothetical protein MLD38_005201 [Melastoma candidum]
MQGKDRREDKKKKWRRGRVCHHLNQRGRSSRGRLPRGKVVRRRRGLARLCSNQEKYVLAPSPFACFLKTAIAMSPYYVRPACCAGSVKGDLRVCLSAERMTQNVCMLAGNCYLLYVYVSMGKDALYVI